LKAFVGAVDGNWKAYFDKVELIPALLAAFETEAKKNAATFKTYTDSYKTPSAATKLLAEYQAYKTAADALTTAKTNYDTENAKADGDKDVHLVKKLLKKWYKARTDERTKLRLLEGATGEVKTALTAINAVTAAKGKYDLLVAGETNEKTKYNTWYAQYLYRETDEYEDIMEDEV
jgi:hypothetical protein